MDPVHKLRKTLFLSLGVVALIGKFSIAIVQPRPPQPAGAP